MSGDAAEIAAGLEFGSRSVACAVVSAGPGSARVLGASRVETPGVRGGAVVGIAPAARAIAQAVAEASAQAGKLVESVRVGIRGKNIHCLFASGARRVARLDKELVEEDVEAAVHAASAVHLDAGEVLHHVLPLGFALDGTAGVWEPVGMRASLIEARVGLVVVRENEVRNILGAVAEAGLRADAATYTPVALGELLFMREEQEAGVVLLDLGGTVSSLSAYKEGRLVFAQELPIGSDSITRDIAGGLGVSVGEAERVKVERAVGHPDASPVVAGREFAVAGPDDTEPRTVSRDALMKVVLPRVEEILDLACRSLRAVEGDMHFGAGVVLCGGGARLPGIARSAGQVFELTARARLKPARLEGPVEALDADFVRACALALHPGVEADAPSGFPLPSRRRGFWERLGRKLWSQLERPWDE